MQNALLSNSNVKRITPSYFANSGNTFRPGTLAGVAAVLRFANEIEDGGMEWPNTDTIGREGWHYQLRASMAEAVEQLLPTY